MRHGPVRRMCGGYIVDRIASDRRRARLWRGLEIAIISLNLLIIVAGVALIIFLPELLLP